MVGIFKNYFVVVLYAFSKSLFVAIFFSKILLISVFNKIALSCKDNSLNFSLSHDSMIHSPYWLFNFSNKIRSSSFLNSLKYGLVLIESNIASLTKSLFSFRGIKPRACFISGLIFRYRASVNLGLAMINSYGIFSNRQIRLLSFLLFLNHYQIYKDVELQLFHLHALNIYCKHRNALCLRKLPCRLVNLCVFLLSSWPPIFGFVSLLNYSYRSSRVLKLLFLRLHFLRNILYVFHLKKSCQLLKNYCLLNLKTLNLQVCLFLRRICINFGNRLLSCLTPFGFVCFFCYYNIQKVYLRCKFIFKKSEKKLSFFIDRLIFILSAKNQNTLGVI